MSENQRRILELLKDGKITVAEAERLLALAGTEPDERRDLAPGTTAEKKRAPKYIRVVVQPAPDAGPGAERVNVRVPLNLIRAGMKFTSLIPQAAADEVQEALNDKGVKFDLRNIKDSDVEELIAALGDLEVDVESGKEKVHVYME